MADRLNDLRESVAYLQDELRSIHTGAENRSLSEDEDGRFSDGVWLRDALIAEGIDLERRQAEAVRSIERPGAQEFSAPNVVKSQDWQDPTYQRDAGSAEAVRRYIGESSRLSDEARSEVERKTENRDGSVYGRPEHVSRFVLAHASDLYADAFNKLVSGREYEMTGDERAALQHARSEERAVNITTEATGEALIPSHLDPTVISTQSGSLNPFRAISRVVSVTSNVWNGVSAPSISASWDSEGAEVSDDSPIFAAPSVTCHKGQAFIPVTQEALEDIGNLGAEVSKLFADAKDNLEATAFATGSGSGQPKGIVTALTGSANETAMATNSSFAVGDIFSASEALPVAYRANSSWLMNQVHINDVREFGGSNFYTRTVTLDQGPSGSVLGRPVYESSALSSTLDGDTNLNIVLGDFSNFLIADRIGATVSYVPHLFAVGNNRPNGQSGWNMHWRTGSDAVNSTAFVLLYNPST